MDFFVPDKIKVDVQIKSGKQDSLENLKQLLDNKEELANRIAQALADQLEIEANVTLHSSKDAYINAISVNGDEVSLDTSDFVVNMVENGIEPFDMKAGMLNSNKTKIMKDGTKYLVVPLSKFKNGRYNWRDRSTGRFDKGSNQGGDVEFRIVSEKSNPQSWIHPGHPGFNLIEKTIDKSDEIIDEFLDDQINIILNDI